PVGLIGAGRSGELATIDAVRRRGHEAMPERGVLTVTVPGTVEAWGRLIERFGTLGWSPVLEPAAALAQDGYTITSHLSDALKNAAGLLGRESVAHALYPPMDAGMVLRNPDLASVLKDISRHGFNGLYRGEIAATIAAAIPRRDGFVTAQDLAGHRSEWVETVTLPYRDGVVHELPPPTQGLIALGLLKVLRDRTKAELQPGPEFVEMFRSARNTAYSIRDRITDPDFSPVPDLATSEVPDGGDTVYLCAAAEP